MRSVVRMANWKPCQFSEVGAVHENESKVPMNWMVPWPSVPRSTLPGSCDSEPLLPPQ